MYKGKGIERFDLMISSIIALSIHAGIFLGGGFFYSEPLIILKKGKSSIKMTFVASRPAMASEVVQEPHVIEILEEKEPEIAPLVEEEELKLPVEEKEEEKSEEKKEEKKENNQVNSEEIVADLKEKGVITDTEAERADFHKPEYPEYCRKRGQEGVVVLTIRISADATGNSIKIVKSSGYLRLDNAAVEALKRAKFVPARRMGTAVTTTKKVAFRFRLLEEEKRK